MDDKTENTDTPSKSVPPTIRLTPASGKTTPPEPPKIRLQPASPAVPKTSLLTDAARAKKRNLTGQSPACFRPTPRYGYGSPIKLSASEKAPDPQDEPKSIKIKRPGTAALRPPTIESKKATARVDIQDALASSTGAEPLQPKTIRLKRPGTTIIEKAQQPRPETTSAFRIEDAKKSETSRIELPSEASVEIPRRRKTVQIKRSSGGPATRTISTGAPSATFSTASDDTFITFKAEDESTVVFSLVSLVASIVTVILLYVLAAQTVLPSLPWPGKL